MSLLLLLPRLKVGAPTATDTLGSADSVARGLVIARRAFAEIQAPVQRSTAANDLLGFPHVFTRTFTGSRAIAQSLSFADAAVGAITSGTLPIGGTESLRGPQTYTLLTPTATVAAPYGLAQVNTARAAAGVNGVVRLPHAGSPYNFTWDLSVAGQTWQAELATTIFNGDHNITAAGVTWEGGIKRGGIFTSSGSTPNVTIRNVLMDQLGLGDRSCIVADNFHTSGNWLISQIRFYDNGPTSTNADNPTTGNFRSMVRFTAPAGVTMDGMRIEHSILDRAAGHGGDTISSTGATNFNKNFVVHNCRLDGGLAAIPNTSGTSGIAYADGYFGIEVWRSVANTSGILRSDGLAAGGIVQYCDLSGGSDVLMSMTGTSTTNNWVHHNKLAVGVPASAGAQTGRPFGVYEFGGDTHTGVLFEYNDFAGNGRRLDGGKSGALIYGPISGAHGCTIRYNTIRDIDKVVTAPAGSNPGGGFTIDHNCVNNYNGLFAAGATFTVANTIGTNDATACGY